MYYFQHLFTLPCKVNFKTHSGFYFILANVVKSQNSSQKNTLDISNILHS